MTETPCDYSVHVMCTAEDGGRVSLSLAQVRFLVNTGAFDEALRRAIAAVERIGPSVMAATEALRAFEQAAARRAEMRRIHTAYRARKRGRW